MLKGGRKTKTFLTINLLIKKDRFTIFKEKKNIMKRKMLLLTSLLALLALVLTACGGGGGAEAEFDLGDYGSFLEAARAGEYEGTVVTMTGPFTDEDAVKFNNTVAAFEEETGIDIQYEGSKEFEATIGIRVEGGDAPDIVDFPQPGLLATFVATGDVIDLSTYLDREDLKTRYNESWLDMAMMEGEEGEIMAGVWQRVNGKSLVWYCLLYTSPSPRD